MKIDEMPGAIHFGRKANEYEWMGNKVQYMQRHELNIFVGYLLELLYSYDYRNDKQNMSEIDKWVKETNDKEWEKLKNVKQTENKVDMV